jgi:hypothetical protein
MCEAQKLDIEAVLLEFGINIMLLLSCHVCAHNKHIDTMHIQ